MTMQIPDLIYYEGRRRELLATPLEAYFEQTGGRPAIESSYSALWRGYIATWRLEAGRLFLVHFKPGMTDGPKFTLSTLFPGQGRRVSAAWFTGDLPIATGRSQGVVLVEVVAGLALCTRMDEPM